MMGSKLAATDTYQFEQWLLQNHPDLFDEWEMEACEWLDLDDWLWQEYYEIVDEWWEHKKKSRK